MALTLNRGGEREALVAALGAVMEGITFYDLADVVVAETRVKLTFETLGRRKRAQLGKLEAVLGSEFREIAPRPGIYPLDLVSRTECYVCGHAIDTAAMPSQCPKCGAARYAFEKEIAQPMAWEIAAMTARKTAALLRLQIPKADGAAKSLLEELAREEDATAEEADGQRAPAKS